MYQVIARKYRPQTFEDVVSQEHVKRTLANAIDHGRIAHGYIFSGPRGTGKTTMARLLAMALNCENGPSSKFDPETDPICQEIAAGSAMDVIEIDAASNRRIDDIRELRESVRYRPVRDRYKFFIIDEAHQITTDAFNALLKTLEEPPEWVVFVLCTTEPQAIPATIQSRCQSFPFRTVEFEQVVERMRWICEQEGVQADHDALVAIALAGDGSIRDSLSILDQAIASCGNRLAALEVRDLLGAIPAEIIDRIFGALRENEAPAMLDVVDRVFREGRHPQHFAGELCRQFRNLLVMKVTGADTKLVAAGGEERERSAAVLEYFSPEDLTRYTQLLLDLYRDLQEATQPRFSMELGLLKLVYAGKLRAIEDVIAEFGGNGAAEAKIEGRATTPAPRRKALSPSASQKAKPEQPSQSASPAPASSGLREQLASALRNAGEDFFSEAVSHSTIEEKGAEVLIRSTPHDRTTLELGGIEAIEDALRKVRGPGRRVKLGEALPETDAPASVSESPQTVSANEPSPLETETARRALADPDVQAFQQRFRGQVREVRNLRDYSA